MARAGIAVVVRRARRLPAKARENVMVSSPCSDGLRKIGKG
jgi:hypothetical protein